MNKQIRCKTYDCRKPRDCWCRAIVLESATEEELQENDEPGNKYWIIGSASLNKEEAEYFVKLHNENLER